MDAMNRLGLGVLLLGLPLALLWPAGCSQQRAGHNAEKAPQIRVRLLSSQQQVLLSATASPLVESSGERVPRRLDFPRDGASVAVSLSSGGWRIGSAQFAVGELTLTPAGVGSLFINGSSYRGRYRFVPVSADRFDVVNDVDIESYLMSVVSREMLRDWTQEAYRAQAIVARTYALYEARTAGIGRHYDVTDDTRSQVYGGIAAETANSRQAVLHTEGIVVAYGPRGNERIFKAYFSSCCGGVGQSAADAFGDPDIPPLREKRSGNLCNASPRFNWGPIIITRDELTRRMRIWGARRNRPEKDMSTIVSIEIAAVNPYQRPVRFYVTDSRGLRYSLSGEELRWACNTDANGGAVLYSSFVRPVSQGDAIHFVEGHGWGHGVGMCQWCAQALALRGVRHEDIVRYSYPGAVLVRAY
jgi:stage II sporulation protein D